MSKPPAFQVYARDVLSDEACRMMGLDGFGLYWRLLMHQWLEGSIPSDPVDISILVGFPVEDVWPKVKGRFQGRTGDRIFNKRLAEQSAHYKKMSKKASESGKIGARKRWEGHDVDRVPIKTPLRSDSTAVCSLQSATATATTTTSTALSVSGPSESSRILDGLNVVRADAGMTKLQGDKVGLRYLNARLAEHDVDTLLRVVRYAPSDSWIADGMKLALAPIFSPRSFPALLDRMDNQDTSGLSAGDRRLIQHRKRMEGVSL